MLGDFGQMSLTMSTVIDQLLLNATSATLQLLGVRNVYIPTINISQKLKYFFFIFSIQNIVTLSY